MPARLTAKTYEYAMRAPLAARMYLASVAKRQGRAFQCHLCCEPTVSQAAVNLLVSRMSRELEPTHTSNDPLTGDHACVLTSQIEGDQLVSGNSTCRIESD